MTRLSIVMLKGNDTGRFEESLASVLANRPAQCEILVVCPGGYEDPYALGDEVLFLDAPPGLSAAGQLNLAFAHVTSEVIHLLGCGLTVAEDWAEPAVDCFQDASIAAVVPLVVDAVTGRVVSAGVRSGLAQRRLEVRTHHPIHSGPDLHPSKRGNGGSRRRPRRGAPLGPALQAAFYRRSAIVELGGFDENIADWLLDLDAAISLRAWGYRATLAPDCQLAGESLGVLPTRFEEGRGSERLFWKHRDSASALWWHAWAVALETALTVGSGRAPRALLGRCVALLELLRGKPASPPLAAAAESSQHDPRPAFTKSPATRSAA